MPDLMNAHVVRYFGYRNRLAEWRGQWFLQMQYYALYQKELDPAWTPFD